MKLYRLKREQFVPAPIEAVFAFYADASNLEQLTPPFLRFRMVSPTPVAMRPGTLIDYRIRVHGLPMTWRSEITVWNPPYRFVDEQIRGPYRVWIHLHEFEPARGGTIVRDSVRYAVPGGDLVQRFLIAPDLERIFDYREKKLREIFGDEPSAATA